MIVTRKKITEEEYYKYINSSKEEIRNFVYNIATQSSCHPCGYGFFSPRLEKTDTEFFAIWEHWDSCD